MAIDRKSVHANPAGDGRRRAGFTAIEMLVVVSVLILLTAMSVPGLVGAVRRGRVNEAASAVIGAATTARQLARTSARSSDYFGVVVVADEVPAYVAVTYGRTADKASILLANRARAEGPDNQPLYKRTLNRNVMIYSGAQPLIGSNGWMYQYRTGVPVVTAATNAPAVDIAGISLRTLDGRQSSALAIYRVGLINVLEF